MGKAAMSFISAIGSTGGVVRFPNGLCAPVADEDWIDLGEAYVEMCESVGQVPMVRETPEEED